MRMPDLELPATDGTLVNPAMVKGRAVWVIYPYTGKPGVPDPEGWDYIRGAHGSTPQLLSYSMCYEEFHRNHINIFGVSLQDIHWQREFVARYTVPFALLSDAAAHFTTALGLEKFTGGAAEFLKRRTLISHDGVILHDRTHIADPSTDASEVLAWQKSP